MISIRSSIVAKKPVIANKTKSTTASKKVHQTVSVGVCTLGAALSFMFPSPAFADKTIMMGSDSGALVFEPALVTVARGEKITFMNNKSFPHSVMFDEDHVPEGVDVDSISHDLLNAPGETFEIALDKVGHYEYYCAPHQGAGMKGAIDVVDE